MKKALVYLFALCAPACLHAAYTFNISAAGLYDENGNAASKDGLVLLVADTSADGFATLSESTPMTLNSFINGPSNDDLILARWQLGASSGSPGLFSDTATNLSLTGNWNAGDPLALMWFPSLTTSSTAAGAGVRYGMYSNLASAGDSSLNGGDRWVTQGDGTYSLNFFTDSFGGSPRPDSAAYATLTVSGTGAVPEPSRVLLLGVGLGTMLFRRRRA